MKQAFILCILALVLAQLPANEMDVAGFLGINGNTFYGESGNKDHIQPAVNFHIGSMIQTETVDNMILGSELLYIQKGANFKYESNNGVDEYLHHDILRYLQLGILGKVSYPVEMIELQPCVGMHLAYLISAARKWDKALDYEDLDFTKSCQKLDLGLSLGSDAIVYNKVLVGARMEVGLLKVFDPHMGDNKSRNLNFRIYLGYLFPVELNY